MIGPRPVRREDVPALKDLWREVFHDPEDMIEAFFRELFRPRDGAVVTDGDRNTAAGAWAGP